MSSISTHILDTSLGRPAAGVPITLERDVDGSWLKLSAHTTDDDGRVQQVAESPLPTGTYRLSFATQLYFEALNVIGLYPLIQIIFLVRDEAAHYHIPLLLTANGYSTYRGS